MRKFVCVLILCMLSFTLIACRKNFTVTFNSDGGSIVSTQTVKNGKTATKPADPTKDGFDFIGWYLGDSEYDFSAPVEKTITLIAKWKENIQSFTVSFDTDGGNEISSQTVIKNGKLTPPNNPTKDGYEFIGWYLGQTEFDFNSEITQDITLKAKWEENIIRHRVFFDSQGGGDIPFQTIESGSFAMEPEIPQKEGWLFMGWYEGDNPFNFANPITKETYLTAKWEEKIIYYSVVLLSEGVEITSLTVAQGERLEVAQVERSGYEFLGWYLNGEPFNFDEPINDNIVLRAEWKKIETDCFTVTFITNCEISLDVETVQKGESVSYPDDLTKDGYNFLGWFLNDEEYDFSTAITENITLVAKWEEIIKVCFTVVFDSDGGTFVETQEIEENGFANLPKNPSKDGFVFAGWFLGESEFDFTLPITKDIVLTAQWKEINDIDCLVGEWIGCERSEYADFAISLEIFEGGTGLLNYYNSLSEEIASYVINKIEYIGEEIILYLEQNQVVITLEVDGEKLVGKCVFGGETELIKQ